MKKLKVLSFTFLIGAMLTGCGAGDNGKQPSEDKKTTATSTEEKKDVKSDLTTDEVFEKVIKKSEKYESYLAETKTTTEFESKSNSNSNSDLKAKSTNSVKLQYVKEPFNLYMETESSAKNLSNNDTLNFKIKSYINDKGFYINNESTKQWIKYNDSAFKSMKGQLTKNLSDQLVEYKKYSSEFKMENEGTTYHIYVKKDSKKFNVFLQGVVNQQLTELMGREQGNTVKDPTFKDVEYELFIDKETFDILEVKFNLTLNGKINNEKVDMKIQVDGNYSEFNKVKPTALPKEAEKKAKSI